MKRFLAVSLVIICIVSFFSACSGSSQGIGEAGISTEEFDSLRLGMSHDEVDSIIGGEGELVSESEEDDDEYLITVFLYRYEGENGGYAELEFTLKTHKGYTPYNFQSYSLTGKTKYNLK